MFTAFRFIFQFFRTPFLKKPVNGILMMMMMTAKGGGGGVRKGRGKGWREEEGEGDEGERWWPNDYDVCV